MKLLTQISLGLVVLGAGASMMYAAPGAEMGDASHEQMLAKAQTLRAEMAAVFDETEALQAQARKQSDVIMLNCVNDKLVAMKAQLRIADHAFADLQSQVEDKAALDTLVNVGNDVRSLHEASQGCVGKQTLLTDTSNSYTAPDLLDPLGTTPFGGLNSFEPPAYASPSK